MTNIDILAKKYKFDPLDFDTARKNYYNFCFPKNSEDFSLEKSNNAYKCFCDSLTQVIDVASSELKLKESCTIYSPKKIKIPIVVAMITETTNISFTLGLFRDFYVATEFNSPQNIKFMNDDFWELLFKLSSLGKFGFKEREQPDKAMRKRYSQLFNKRGNYYKLLRNYFLFEVNYGSVGDLGSFSVSWDNFTNFEELIPKICETFKIMYRINFLLFEYGNKNIKLRT